MSAIATSAHSAHPAPSESTGWPPAAAYRAAHIGLWALPAYGLLLGLSTLTHQPPVDNFDAYARYVSSDVFLVSHLGASIFGAALAILGAIALTTLLAHGPAARLAIAGLTLTTISNVFMASTFGSAAFVQPGIGRAHLAGTAGMPTLNADTAYGPAMFGTALSATSLLIIAAISLGTAVARTSPRLRLHGIGYAVLIPAFAVSGFALQPIQAWTGIALAVVSAALAIRLPATITTNANLDGTAGRPDDTRRAPATTNAKCRQNCTSRTMPASPAPLGERQHRSPTGAGERRDRSRTLRRPEPHLSFRVYPERRAEAGIGEQVKFATKPAKGLAMLERALDAGLPAKWVAADEAYGKDTKFRLGLQRRHVRYVLACNQKIPTESRSSRAVTLAVRAPRSGVETT